MHELIKKIKHEKMKVDEVRDLLKQREVLEEQGKDVSPIDRKLDLFDEEIETKFQKLQQEFIEKHYPHFANEHKEIERSKEETQKQLSLLTPFYHLLLQGKKILTSKRKKGLLDIFFGRPSQALLAHLLHDSSEEAKKILPHTQDTISAYLKIFINEVERSWNHKLYQGKFLHLFLQFSALYEQLEEESEKIEQRLKKSEEHINSSLYNAFV